MSADPPPPTDPPPRVASLGISTAEICGVRDHGALLAGALAREGWDCSTLWLEREGETLAQARAQVDAWTRALPGRLAEARADVALLHYSVFAFSFRGVPLFVRPVLAAVRRAGIPLVTLLHEFVYPWGRDGLRGAAWAVSQRALLIAVMRRSDAVVTTTEFQAEWLASRPWLARRIVASAPVFSNLPAPSPATAEGSPSAPERAGATIGLFGYGYGPAAAALVAGALRLLQQRGVRAGLQLLGAPGRDSPAGETWLAAAREAGLEQPPDFSGALGAQQLSDALAACNALLFVDPIGPNSRKTTLAASLASGRPVVAVDGPRRFQELADAGAAEIVAPQPPALADALAALLADPARADRLGHRGRAFADQSMSAARAARTIAGLLRDVTA
jgi:glycosyltransferase involved in cell wall biosynthesis